MVRRPMPMRPSFFVPPRFFLRARAANYLRHYIAMSYLYGGYSSYPMMPYGGYGSSMMSYGGGSGSYPMMPSSASHGSYQAPDGTSHGSYSSPSSSAILSNEYVSVLDNNFKPQKITVPVGTLVQWTNLGRHKHTVTSDTGLWDSGELAPGQDYSHTFKEPGTYPYHCTIHAQQMRGVVIVK